MPSIDGEFVLDDTGILWNPFVLHPFRHSVEAWLRSSRPITTFTFALNHLVVGPDTRGWHLTNVAIHLGVVGLAWFFARLTLSRAGLSRPDGPAIAVAGLFALHPLQTESVAYITQRAESLASGVYLAAMLLLLLRDEASTALRRNALFAAAMALQTIGLATKPIVATLPAAWLVHSAIVPPSGEVGTPAWRCAWRRVPAALPLFALSACAAFVMLGGTAGSVDAGLSVPGLPPDLYLATQLRVIPTYLSLLFWPVGQCADWYFPASRGFLDPAVLGGAALLGGIAGLAIFAAVRFRGSIGDGPAAARVAGFGALFFLIALAPSSSIIPLLDPLAEHRVYLAALGVFLAVCAGATVALRRLPGVYAKATGVTLGVAVLVIAGITTARRNTVWSSSLALWSDTAAKAPRKARVHLNLGNALFYANHPTDALASFYRARDLQKDYTVSEHMLLERIVYTLVALGRLDNARAEIDRTLAASPRNAIALALLARVEYASGRDTEAERAALAAVAVAPKNPLALKYLGAVRLRRGDVEGGREALRAAAATDAVDPYLFWLLGNAEERSGEIVAACAAYTRAAGQPGNRRASGQSDYARLRLRCP